MCLKAEMRRVEGPARELRSIDYCKKMFAVDIQRMYKIQGCLASALHSTATEAT
jgi:hypothetical protein